jgi:hypothetical protein
MTQESDSESSSDGELEADVVLLFVVAVFCFLGNWMRMSWAAGVVVLGVVVFDEVGVVEDGVVVVGLE